ncbi:MAG: hypothetical protein M3003_16360, partial [Candidatus Dormibacteraeota bacterium]|nr:hypothetical protein [Candidatus Dormibacteraeota bacterium]
MAVRTRFRSSGSSLYSYRFGGASAPRSTQANSIFGSNSQQSGAGGGGAPNRVPVRPAGAPAGAQYFGEDATGNTVAWQYPDGTTHFFVNGAETAATKARPSSNLTIAAITQAGGKFTVNDPNTGQSYYTMPNGQVVSFNP